MRHPLLAAMVFIVGPSLQAQDCSIPFTTPLFGVQEEQGIWYGNATRFDGGTDSLRLNLYKPIGDGQPDRPLVVCVHGGGFTGGHRNDLNALCADLASRGWAAATISYRLGFYGTWLLGNPYTYDEAEVVRAAYRAVQDTRGAIRFLRGRSAQDSTSNQHVIVLGFSAGGITALHTAYADEPAEKPGVCAAITPVYHFLTQYPRPDLGPIEGTLNQNGESTDVIAAVSYFGALLDTTFIQSPNDPALYMYHQTGDPVVGCGYQRGLYGLPLGIGDNYPYLYGSCSIAPRATNLGFAPDRFLYHEYQGIGHEVHDPASILQESTQFMRDLFCGISTLVAEEPRTSLRVHPNPTRDLLRIELGGVQGPVELDVTDLAGRMVLTPATFAQHPLQVDLGSLSEGMYLVRLRGRGLEHVERVVVGGR